MAESTRPTVTASAVIGWFLLAVLTTGVVGYGLATVGAMPFLPASSSEASIESDLKRVGELLGLDREGVVVHEVATDPWAMLEAGTLVDAAVQRSPRAAAAHRLRAIHRLAAGELDTALTAAQRAVDLAPEGLEHHLVLGAVQTQARDFAAAAATFRHATGQWPSSVEAWHGLGQVLWLLGDEAGSRAAYERKLAVKNARATSAPPSTP